MQLCTYLTYMHSYVQIYLHACVCVCVCQVYWSRNNKKETLLSKTPNKRAFRERAG